MKSRNMNDELNHLFSKYHNQFNSQHLNEIVNREYVYSKLNQNANILICGINPSYRVKEDNPNAYEFDFNDEKVKKDPYFKKFHDKTKGIQTNYIDLLRQRHTSQSDIGLFMKEEKGLQFIIDQLKVSQNAIENLKPKLILVFNRMAGQFWGRDAIYYKNGNARSVWMGYTFIPTEIEGAMKITGIIQHSDRINQSLKQTNLIGTIIYFSSFISYRTSRKVKTKINKDVPALINQYV
jgi:hypothetical protein